MTEALEVTVVIPTFNRWPLIAEAVRSVLLQSYKNFELLVVDDGSVDATETELAKIRDCRLRVIKKTNGGVSSARNKGLDMARGRYICFLDSDDLWGTDYLETMVAAMEKNTDCGVAYGRKMYVTDTGARSKESDEKCVSGDVSRSFFVHTAAAVQGSCFRAEAVKNMRFEEGLASAEDVDFILRLAISQKFIYVPEATVTIRTKHSVNKRIEYSNENCNRIRVLERLYFKLGANKVIPACEARAKLAKSYRSCAKYYISKSNGTAARWLLGRAISYKPLFLQLYIDWVRALFLPKGKWDRPKPLGAARFLGAQQ